MGERSTAFLVSLVANAAPGAASEIAASQAAASAALGAR
jgi:hypothetical protein